MGAVASCQICSLEPDHSPPKIESIPISQDESVISESDTLNSSESENETDLPNGDEYDKVQIDPLNETQANQFTENVGFMVLDDNIMEVIKNINIPAISTPKMESNDTITNFNYTQLNEMQPIDLVPTDHQNNDNNIYKNQVTPHIDNIETAHNNNIYSDDIPLPPDNNSNNSNKLQELASSIHHEAKHAHIAHAVAKIYDHNQHHDDDDDEHESDSDSESSSELPEDEQREIQRVKSEQYPKVSNLVRDETATPWLENESHQMEEELKDQITFLNNHQIHKDLQIHAKTNLNSGTRTSNLIRGKSEYKWGVNELESTQDQMQQHLVHLVQMNSNKGNNDNINAKYQVVDNLDDDGADIIGIGSK